MRLNRIINSLLETDMYKFSMGQAIFHQFTDYRTTWTFRCRNKDVKFTPEMVEEIKDQITSIAESQPLHTVIPYRNIPKHLYPKNIVSQGAKK